MAISVRDRGWPAWIFCWGLFLTLNSAGAAEPTPLQDDATLHAVQFLGPDHGWVCGDHGTVWQTTDGGITWRFHAVPATCPLRAISFVTPRVGWIAGGGTIPHTRQSAGAILFTKDGGETWQSLIRDELPELYQIRFFNLERGIATCRPNPQFPSGVITTTDGGKTWQPVGGTLTGSWRAGDFPHPERGIVVGQRGRVALVGGDRLLTPRSYDLGSRGLRSVRVPDDAPGWLVGEGGLLLRTVSEGLVWEAPPESLPGAVEDLFDFQAVAVRGDRVWAAGQPGSVIWHTADGGKSWQPLSTGQPLPLFALAFPTDEEGWAVGAMGTILHSRDGGLHWDVVKGYGRRAAFFAVHARAAQVSLRLLTELSGESGYRGVVAVLPRHGIGPDGAAGLDLDLALHDAVQTAGGSHGEVSWRFPVDVEGLDRNQDRLIAEWMKQTEGRLVDLLLGQLVGQLRTWRPSVVVIDEPPPGDAVAKLINQAVLRAVTQAADPTAFPEQCELGGLTPWTVQKIYARLPPNSTGDAHIDPQHYLARLEGTVAMIAATAEGRLAGTETTIPLREDYRLVRHELNGTANIGHFFAGLQLAPGSDARRALIEVREDGLEARLKLAQRQRNFEGYVDRFLVDPRHAEQLIAQLRDVTRGAPPDQAAHQMMQLARNYRRLGRWDLAESTLVELVERYPGQPAAQEGMIWLLQLWSGFEPSWRRSQATSGGADRISTNTDTIAAKILQAGGQQPGELPPPPPVSGQGNPFRADRLARGVAIDAGTDLQSSIRKNWYNQAKHMAEVMEKTAPALSQTPEVRFPLAAAYRALGQSSEAQLIYHKFTSTAGAGPWQRTAQGETWLVNPLSVPPKSLTLCRRTDYRPALDGLLADPCWEAADEIPLLVEGQQRDNGAHPFALLSYDDEFLYLAASLPRKPGLPDDLPQLTGRTHDADLSQFDQLTLLLDLDRDAATYYRFTVDQRGWTAEDCWGDASWNPTWFVAAAADAKGWRVEVAIPFKELGPEPPGKNTVWNASLIRIAPAVETAGWTHPASATPRPETGGFLKFD